MIDKNVKKVLVFAVILLFIGVAVTPSIGVSGYLDDTTPPVTTISFDPPETDGLNGWYVSSVTVTLNATDGDSGVNVTIYKIDHGMWQIYAEPFILSVDGVCLIEYFSIDNAGNQEEVKSAIINIDKTKPEIELEYEVTGGNQWTGWEITFTAKATDSTSGMDRVEFYLNNTLQETVVGSGPTYTWILYPYPNQHITIYALAYDIAGNIEIGYPPTTDYPTYIMGIISNVNYNEDRVTFFAIIALIKTEEIGTDIILFQHLNYPNYYHGYIGKHFIFAVFWWT